MKAVITELRQLPQVNDKASWRPLHSRGKNNPQETLGTAGNLAAGCVCTNVVLAKSELRNS